MPVYKDEQRGTFFCSFYYTDWTGEKKKKTKRGFKLKREAQAFERSFLEQTQGAPTMTFASLVELYLADARTRLREVTYKSKEYIIKAKILPYFEKLSVDQITPAHIRKWQNKLLSFSHKETYLRSLHNTLSTIFNFAIRYYNLKENPCRKAGPIGRLNAEEMSFWTRQEYLRFIKVLEDDAQAHLFFQLLYWTGIRTGEALALTPEDFDIESKMLFITKSYQRIEKRDVITEPKTQKSKRTVILPAFICQEACAYFLRMPSTEARLFQYSRKYFVDRLIKGCEMAGVKRIRLHDIRHSHASLLIELGFSPLMIAERLGHEKVETTLDIYSHLYPNKQAELAERLESLE